MKFVRHYLGELMCPLNRDFSCNSRCAWFDNEEEDCRLMLYIGDISRIFTND